MNSATDVRCLHCSTTLIDEAVGHSKEYQQAADLISVRMHSGVGAALGFVFVGFLLTFVFTAHSLSERQVVLASWVGAFIGSFFWRLLFKAKRDFWLNNAFDPTRTADSCGGSR
jgi:hypothetical protein